MTNTHSQYGPAALWQELKDYAPTARRWLVGYSGGLDSTALLAALQALDLPQPIVAIYVHHGLSSFADQWQAHCQAQCEAWGIECRVARVAVHNAGFGVEDAAREARYQAYRELAEEGDVLLLGHHQDDQAETLLFRLLRGTGPRGLGGIVRERELDGATILRPLLAFSKEQLEEYVRGRGLSWVTDDSNVDESFDRNFLRQRIMPLLVERWPGFPKRWQQTAEACQIADRLSRDLALVDLAGCQERKERWGWSLELSACRELPDYRQENLLRYWALERGMPPMDRKALSEIRRQFLDAAEPSSRACVTWAAAELRYFRGRLYVGSALPEFSPPEPTALQQSQTLAGGGRLVVEPAKDGLRVDGNMELRWRSGGERCRPVGRQHSQTLKKLLQEYGLEPWLRDRVPLVYLNGTLAAVADLWICEGFQAQPGESGLRLEWRLP